MKDQEQLKAINQLLALVTLNIINLCLYHLLQPAPILTQALPYQIFELSLSPWQSRVFLPCQHGQVTICSCNKQLPLSPWQSFSCLASMAK